MDYDRQVCAIPFTENTQRVKNGVERFVKLRFQGNYQKAFKHYDKAKGSQGSLTKTELESLFKDACKGFHSRIAEGIIESFDTDKSGTISYQELDKVLNNRQSP